MSYTIAAFGRTLKTLYDTGLWRVIFLSALLNILLWTVLVSGVWYCLHATTLSQAEWVEWLVDTLGFGLVTVIALFLFPFTFPLAVSLFCERIADRVEHKEYPDAQKEKIHTPLLPQLWAEASFLGVTLVLNAILLPLYFIPVLNVVVICLYYAVNGYLLGREFFTLVAMRYHSRREVEALRKSHRLKLMAAGALVLVLSTMPLINIIIPAVAVVMMVHLYQKVQNNGNGRG